MERGFVGMLLDGGLGGFIAFVSEPNFREKESEGT